MIKIGRLGSATIESWPEHLGLALHCHLSAWLGFIPLLQRPPMNLAGLVNILDITYKDFYFFFFIYLFFLGLRIEASHSTKPLEPIRVLCQSVQSIWPFLDGLHNQPICGWHRREWYCPFCRHGDSWPFAEDVNLVINTPLMKSRIKLNAPLC